MKSFVFDQSYGASIRSVVMALPEQPNRAQRRALARQSTEEKSPGASGLKYSKQLMTNQSLRK